MNEKLEKFVVTGFTEGKSQRTSERDISDLSAKKMKRLTPI